MLTRYRRFKCRLGLHTWGWGGEKQGTHIITQWRACAYCPKREVVWECLCHQDWAAFRAGFEAGLIGEGKSDLEVKALFQRWFDA